MRGRGYKVAKAKMMKTLKAIKAEKSATNKWLHNVVNAQRKAEAKEDVAETNAEVA